MANKTNDDLVFTICNTCDYEFKAPRLDKGRYSHAHMQQYVGLKICPGLGSCLWEQAPRCIDVSQSLSEYQREWIHGVIRATLREHFKLHLGEAPVKGQY